jgi:hypothetical protein
MIPILPKHVHEIGGHKILAIFLQTFSDKPRRRAVLLTLLASSTFNYFKEDMEQLGVIQTLLDIIRDSATQGSLYIRELCMNILANICEDCRPCQKSLRRTNGIETIRDNITLEQVD